HLDARGAVQAHARAGVHRDVVRGVDDHAARERVAHVPRRRPRPAAGVYRLRYPAGDGDRRAAVYGPRLRTADVTVVVPEDVERHVVVDRRMRVVLDVQHVIVADLGGAIVPDGVRLVVVD